MAFNMIDTDRYRRQLVLKDVGIGGQTRMQNSKVCVVGAGGLGCPVVLYLAGAGIGCIGVVDGDHVELSNLHRQIGHHEERIGHLKTTSLSETAKMINSNVQFVLINSFMTAETASEIADTYDVVVDCTDSIKVKYILNDACYKTSTPLVIGSCVGFEGRLSSHFVTTASAASTDRKTPCYRCIFPDPPALDARATCASSGVIGPLPGIIGTMQALEVIKIICDLPGTYTGRLLLFDGLDGVSRIIKLKNRKACRLCGERPTVSFPFDYETFCNGPPQEKNPPREDRVNPSELSALVADGACLVDVRPSHFYEHGHIKGSISLPLYQIKRGDVQVLTDRLSIGSASNHVVVCICRRGNDSQIGARLLETNTAVAATSARICDMSGGLQQWSKDVDDGRIFL